MTARCWGNLGSATYVTTRAKNDKNGAYRLNDAENHHQKLSGITRSINKNGKNMAADRAPSLQDTFLNYVRKNKTPLTIFLVNGVKLQGIVTWFDNFCVLLRRDGHSQLVYKHAISTIMPGGPIQLMEGEQNGGAAG
jgi:host factor-I protein